MSPPLEAPQGAPPIEAVLPPERQAPPSSAKPCDDDWIEQRRQKHNMSQKAYMMRKKARRESLAAAAREAEAAQTASITGVVVPSHVISSVGSLPVAIAMRAATAPAPAVVPVCVAQAEAPPADAAGVLSAMSMIRARARALASLLGADMAAEFVDYLANSCARTPEQALSLALLVERRFAAGGHARAACEVEPNGALRELHSALLRDGRLPLAAALFGAAMGSGMRTAISSEVSSEATQHHQPSTMRAKCHAPSGKNDNGLATRGGIGTYASMLLAPAGGGGGVLPLTERAPPADASRQAVHRASLSLAQLLTADVVASAAPDAAAKAAAAAATTATAAAAVAAAWRKATCVRAHATSGDRPPTGLSLIHI